MRKFFTTIWAGSCILGWLFIIASGFLYAETGEKAVPSSRPKPYSSDQLLIQFKSNLKLNASHFHNSEISLGNSQLDSLNSLFKLREVVPLFALKRDSSSIIEQMKIPQIYLFKFAHVTSLSKLKKYYESLAIIKFVEFNYHYFADHSKSKKSSSLLQLQLEETAHHLNPKHSVITAIIDAGIKWQKKGLITNIWYNRLEKLDGKDNDDNGFVDDIWGWNFVDKDLINQYSLTWDKRPIDYSGHGTQIAEVISQFGNYRSLNKNNDTRNQLMILKAGVFSPEDKIVFTAFASAQAIIYAANNGARIINLSCNCENPSQVLRQAINYAVNKGCIIIDAAGEKNSNQPLYPAAFKNVWAVAATDENDKKLNESNYGDWIDLVAPGLPNENFLAPDSAQFMPSGTAIAAANVTGLAGLLLSCEDIVDNDSLKRRILWSSENIYHENPDYSGKLGVGRINILRAFNSQHQPNIIIQKLSYDLKNKTQYLISVDIVPVRISIKNLSSAAQDVSIKLTTNDPYLTVLKSEIAIPNLDYEQEFTNEFDPFTLIVNRDYPSGHEADLVVKIATSNEFSLEQTFVFDNRMIQPQNLTIINDNPVYLKWTGDPEFIGYHIYRKENEQQSYARITETPILNSTYIDPTIKPGIQYLYYVTGIDSSGWESPSSNEVSITHQWIESLKNAITKLKIKSVFPITSTTLNTGDSLKFHISLESVNDDSLEFQWQINDKIIKQNSDSLFVLFADSLSDRSNRVKVSVANSDTTISYVWNVYVESSLTTFDQLIFSPKLDTTIYERDSLNLFVQITNQSDSLMDFQWLINDEIDSSNHQSNYIFTSDYFSAGIDTIVLNYALGDSTGFHQWLITILNRNRSPETFSCFLPTDTTISIGDTLKFFVNSFDPDQDSLSYQWFINRKMDTVAVDSFYTFFKLEDWSGSDTISVKISDNDTSIFHHGIVHYFTDQNQVPQIISCSPSVDTMLMNADSILFRIHCNDPDGDRLRFTWSLNGRIDTSAHDSTYLYRNQEATISNDTLQAVVADAYTSIMLDWILWAENFETEPKVTSIRWFPEQDSIIAEGDSLIFLVRNANDSYRFQWKINSQIDSSSNNSIFVYHLTHDSSEIDTIQVNVIEEDSLFVHEWHIHYFDLTEKQPPLILAFKPEQDEIITSVQDSYKFSVQILEGNFVDLDFQWSVNNELDSMAIDSIFYYHAEYFITTPDTIQLTVSRGDTAVSHQWVVHFHQQQTLPAPHLIFPIKENRICEEDKLIWENDSSLAQIDSTGDWNYVVQLSSDTLFSKIILSDSCITTSIQLDNLSKFNLVSIGKPIYWRVKIFSGYNKISEFIKCNLPFYYYPQFAQIENFYGQKNVNGTIDLFWITGYESNCAGFNVYRSESQNDNFTKVNENLITGQTNYSFQDKAAQAGKTYYYKLEDISVNGKKRFHYTISVTTPKPYKFSLWQNYPNPFNTQTSIKYEIPAATHVKIIICNVLGRKLKTLVDEDKEAGFYTVFWDGIDDQGENVVSGIYFYLMTTIGGKITRKMIVVR